EGLGGDGVAVGHELAEHGGELLGRGRPLDLRRRDLEQRERRRIGRADLVEVRQVRTLALDGGGSGGLGRGGLGLRRRSVVGAGARGESGENDRGQDRGDRQYGGSGHVASTNTTNSE